MTEQPSDPEPRVSNNLLIHTLVQLADTLINDYDVIEFLGILTERCVTLLDVDEAGIMLADQHGTLQVIASSSERAKLMELFELQNRDGPCLDVFRSGEVIAAADLREQTGRWPTFSREAMAVGIGSVHSVPMRLRRQVIGALNLFRNGVGMLSDDEAVVARALADIATIGLLQERSITELRTTTGQLQTALQSRVLLEQAKGAIAERHSIDVDTAFVVIRNYARSHGRLLTEVARNIVYERFDPGQIPSA